MQLISNTLNSTKYSHLIESLLLYFIWCQNYYMIQENHADVFFIFLMQKKTMRTNIIMYNYPSKSSTWYFCPIILYNIFSVHAMLYAVESWNQTFSSNIFNCSYYIYYNPTIKIIWIHFLASQFT